MTQSSLPNYIDVSTELDKTKSKLHASEAHGIICGVLCGKTDSHALWEEPILGKKPTKEQKDILQALYDASEKQLKEFLFEVELLLPSDGDDLPDRAEALTLWCQGFLTGLKLANIKVDEKEPGEIGEAIDDLIEIAKMDYEEVVASEEDEEAYTELVEYVRMAIILIYEDMHEEVQDEMNGERLH